MGLKETVRHIVTAGGIVTVSIVCSPDDSGQEVFFTPQRPSATPTPERQVNLPTRTAEPTIAPTPTLAPTPEPTPIPIVAPVPEEPVFIPSPTVIVEPQPPPSLPEIFDGQNGWGQILIDKVNQVRLENGLSILNFNPLLNNSANKYTEFLFKNGYQYSPSHYLDGSPQDRAVREGYGAFYVGETLDSGRSSSADEVMQRFLSSPDHRAAILEGRYQDVGASCYQGPYTYPASGETVRWVICAIELGIHN